MLGHPRRETKKVVGAGGGTCPETSGAGQGRLLFLYRSKGPWWGATRGQNGNKKTLNQSINLIKPRMEYALMDSNSALNNAMI